MQKVQMFRFARAKVRGPMGVYEEERMSPCGTGSVSHDGKEYRAGPDGWIEVPVAVHQAIRHHHHVHPLGGYTKWCTPAEVDEPERLGLVDPPAARGPGRPRKADVSGAQAS